MDIVLATSRHGGLRGPARGWLDRSGLRGRAERGERALPGAAQREGAEPAAPGPCARALRGGDAGREVRACR